MKTPEAKRTEISQAERQPFTLDGYKYTEGDLANFMDRISAAAAVPRGQYEKLLAEGGGKAFGLRVCEVIAGNFKGGKYHLTVPDWIIITDPKSVPDSWYNILRSSAPTEDWLDPRSGTFRSFDLTEVRPKMYFERLREEGKLAAIPYILQPKLDGLGMVIDIGYSRVAGRILARIACGNMRKDDIGTTGYFTSAVNDSEASIATWDVHTGEFITPARSYEYMPKFMEKSTPKDNFIQPLYNALVKSGINFGVQMEVIMHPSYANTLYLVQVRPTSEQVYHQIPTRVGKRIIDTEQQVALSAAVNAAFDYTGEPTFFDGEGIQSNFYNTRLTRRIGKGNVGIYTETSTRGLINIYKPGHTANVFWGGYLSGCDVQLTPKAIRPNTHHGNVDVNSYETKVYAKLDSKCGMVSLTEPEIDKLKEQIEADGGKIRIVSDGLLASVTIVKPVSKTHLHAPSSNEQTEVVTDPIRGSEFYKRLKAKFGNRSLAEGLNKDSLTLGDIFDIAKLYQLTTGKNPLPDLDPHMTQMIGRVIENMIGSLPASQRRKFKKQLDLLNTYKSVNSLKRDDPLFRVPADLEKLISLMGYVEISHYPGGIVIVQEIENKERYKIVFTRRNFNMEEPLAEAVFAETGLPVR